MYRLEVRHHFDAAHYLPGHGGKCAHPHGHRWEVVVRYAIETNANATMLVDFGAIKDAIDIYDHTDLNASFTFPSAEQIAYQLWTTMPTVQNYQAYVEVEVWESPNCMVCYSGHRSIAGDAMRETPDLPGEVYTRDLCGKPTDWGDPDGSGQ